MSHTKSPSITPSRLKGCQPDKHNSETMADLNDIDKEIQAARDALEAAQEAHGRAFHLDCLGIALGERFAASGNRTDLDEAVRCSWEAVVLTPEDSPERVGRLSNHGI